MSMILGPAGKDIDEFHVRPEIYRVEDQLYFTNQYEQRLYQVLKKRQAALPDNETIGIMPLGGMRVRRRVLEPDFLITYRGRVAVIELDGPHHRDRASADHSRDRQLRHAGVSFVERLNVEEVNTLDEVEEFVDDFLAQFGR